MTDCNSGRLSFPACRGRRVEAGFDGGEVTSNGGALLLRQADRRLGLTAAVARRLGDRRQRGKLRHGVADLLRQRIFGIALGYEDLNDHAALRHDLALQTATGRDRALASADAVPLREPGRTWAWAVHEVLAATFIASFERPPKEIVLDIDATDDAVHGRQEGRFFHGYYDRLPAAVCVRRRPLAGGLSAAGRYRPGEACPGGIEASGRAPAPGLARGPHSWCEPIRASAAGG